jgi:hypothetical protein
VVGSSVQADGATCLRNVGGPVAAITNHYFVGEMDLEQLKELANCKNPMHGGFCVGNVWVRKLIAELEAYRRRDAEEAWGR